ncbi:glycoside hydrolase family 73 protein [Lacticaseibacillus camelliae]|uniref:N-acetylmuramidase n=1 Tax=Lacticaseibacillus camelliae DSM 22697 = JCM 13995 TaxID=1423730 RepID=A0A0R2FB02_9LACO|nr:glycoside hydrolase family 73 protein [Lacticaseibacillus camelliae]KRN23573.1 N-acetylmuramidase [Lacticaseibacillus camelliae DSM 22697 = JCM 13995]
MAKRRKGLPRPLWLLLAGALIIVALGATLSLRPKPSAPSPQADAHAAFIKRLAPYAQTLQGQYQVLPSITLAQAILESDWGTSTLAKDYHNLFGIKDDDPAHSQLLKTQEYQDGKWVTVEARFRVYPSDQASMKAHAELLVNGPQWNPHLYDGVRQATDYQAAAKALQRAGYATDPTYADKLIRLIDTYDLSKYDQ